jgi:hypothetical protein
VRDTAWKGRGRLHHTHCVDDAELHHGLVAHLVAYVVSLNMASCVTPPERVLLHANTVTWCGCSAARGADMLRAAHEVLAHGQLEGTWRQAVTPCYNTT